MDAPRRIRSFVMRAGRMTDGQQRGWDQGFPRMGLSVSDGPLRWDDTFGGSGRRIIEIGFGMGDSLVAMAAADPGGHYVGIEVHRPGVGRLLSRVDELALANVRVYAEDAVEVLNRCIADASIDAVHIFFPDPWHKKRHHKRRLIQPEFTALLSAKLRSAGVVHLATDWAPYAEQMRAVLDATPGLRNSQPDEGFSPRPSHRPETKFERRGARLGHGVWDLVYHRV